MLGLPTYLLLLAQDDGSLPWQTLVIIIGGILSAVAGMFQKRREDKEREKAGKVSRSDRGASTKGSPAPPRPPRREPPRPPRREPPHPVQRETKYRPRPADTIGRVEQVSRRPVEAAPARPVSREPISERAKRRALEPTRPTDPADRRRPSTRDESRVTREIAKRAKIESIQKAAGPTIAQQADQIYDHHEVVRVPPRKRRRRRKRTNLDRVLASRSGMEAAIVLQEILGPPVAMRDPLDSPGTLP